MTTILGITPETEHLTTEEVDFSVWDTSPSPSPIKRIQGDIPSSHVEGCFSKQAHLTEGVESSALTLFFRLPTILPSRVPRTPKEFVTVVAVEDLAFVLSLSITDI